MTPATKGVGHGHSSPGSLLAVLLHSATFCEISGGQAGNSSRSEKTYKDPIVALRKKIVSFGLETRFDEMDVP